MLQLMLIASTLALSWLWMMIIHEFGDVVMAGLVARRYPGLFLIRLQSPGPTSRMRCIRYWSSGAVLAGSLIPLALRSRPGYVNFAFFTFAGSSRAFA